MSFLVSLLQPPTARVPAAASTRVVRASFMSHLRLLRCSVKEVPLGVSTKRPACVPWRSVEQSASTGFSGDQAVRHIDAVTWECTGCGRFVALKREALPRTLLVTVSGRRAERVVTVNGQVVHRCTASG